MEISGILLLSVLIIATIFSMTSTIISLQFFNQNEKDVKLSQMGGMVSWKSTHMSNYNFLIISLVVSIVILILSFIALFGYFRQ